jgi:hypothetical protein
MSIAPEAMKKKEETKFFPKKKQVKAINTIQKRKTSSLRP